MSPRRAVPVFDADNHLYEPPAALLEHLPDRYKRAIDYVEVRGRTKIMVRGHVSEYIPNPTFEVVARPGAQEEYFRRGNPEGKSYREILGDPVRCIDAWRTVEPRMEILEASGVDRTLMFPTLASLLEERLRDDPETTHAVVHSLNEWLYENWEFNHKDRIFTTPVISLSIVDKALEELDWVIERGARVVLIRPAPVPGLRGPRSMALPEFDPVWQRIVDADLLVAMHGSDSGYSRYLSEWTGASTEMLPFQPNPFRMIASWRPMFDTAASLICHGALSRHPRLKIAMIEVGTGWIEPLVNELRLTHKKMPQMFDSDPVAQLRRNIFVTSFFEEDPAEVARHIGEDNVMFGSDYPHPEGLAEPMSYIDELDHLSDEHLRKFMGGNLGRLMGYPDIVATR
jgi:predicted TIM-barrel fold metal-dependent hydrolase